MTLNLLVSPTLHTDFTPRITVIGVGGGGTNAVDNMIASNLQGVEFVVANTDAQQLLHSRADRRIQLGPHITQGLGAGAKPEVGRAAAEEAADELYRHLDGAHMVFITAGMGGGTGTGAAPVIARMAREKNILTVGVVTKPFTFEGGRRARSADAGIEELQQYVDTLIVIPNQNLFRLANERTGWKEAFKMADNVLYMGVRGVTDLMVAPGLVNLDFADIRTVMAEMGKAMMGTGEADGENRAVRAAEAAISNPLLEDTSMAGARGLLINITGGDDMTLFEVDQAANRIREEVDEEANIIFGSAIDERLNGKVRVSVVATGIESPSQRNAERPRLVAVGGGVPVAAVGTTSVAPAVSSVPGEAPAGMAPQVGSGRSSGVPQFASRPAQRPAILPVPPTASLRSAKVPGNPTVPTAQDYAAAAAEADAAPMQHSSQMMDEQQGEFVAPAQQPRMGQPAQARPNVAQPPRAGSRIATSERPASERPAPQSRASSLFAAEPKAEQPPAPRKSLFGIVTGVIRGSAAQATAPVEAPVTPRAEPQAPEQRADAPRANARPTQGDESGIDIPAFLRRQSS